MKAMLSLGVGLLCLVFYAGSDALVLAIGVCAIAYAFRVVPK